jgi:hypothetical protein
MAGGPAGAAISAGAGLALGVGEYLWNKNQAKKDEKNRPKYEIPAEVGQGLSEAQRQALQGLPEAQKQQYLSNLQRGQAYSLGQSQSRKGGLAGIAALNENQNQGYANLLSQDAGARMANQKQVYNQLQNVADYKGQAFQINQQNPYYEKVARDAANRGALFKNVGNAAQLAGYAAGAQGQKKSLAQGQQPAYASNYGLNNNSPMNPVQPASYNPFAGNAGEGSVGTPFMPQTSTGSNYAPFAPGQGRLGNPFGQ